MSRGFFFAHYTAWALIWGHVLFYYALFAHREWRAAGGRWGAVPGEFVGLLSFTVLPLFADAWALLRGRPLPPDSVECHYAKAHRIAFFIAVAAITYTLMGFSFSLWPDRSQWPLSVQLLSTLLVAATSFAGLGHLYSALEHRTRQWRWFVAAIFLYYPLAIVGFNSLV